MNSALKIDLEDLRIRASGIGIALNPHQLQQFQRYAALLSEWNERLNLTTVQPEHYVERHFLDSLTIATRSTWISSGHLADVGTGAGFPGIPLKIAFPELRLTLIESLQKRCNFLTEVVNALSLKDVAIVAERGEIAAHSLSMRESFDMVSARAVASLRILAEMLLPFIRIGGTLMLLKSDRIDVELNEALETIAICGGKDTVVEKVTVPGILVPSTIVIIAKAAHSPEKVPRSFVAITKRPLQS